MNKEEIDKVAFDDVTKAYRNVFHKPYRNILHGKRLPLSPQRREELRPYYDEGCRQVREGLIKAGEFSLALDEDIENIYSTRTYELISYNEVNFLSNS